MALLHSTSTALACLLFGACASPGRRAGVLIVEVRPEGGHSALEEAKEQVRAAISEQPQRSIEVRLSEGTYFLEQPLVFGPEDGGGARATVTWRAEEGSRVVLSGGRQLDSWQAEADGSWSLDVADQDVPAGRDLLVDGMRRPRARFPRTGWSRVVAPAEDGRTGFEFAPGDLASWPDLEGAELQLVHDWSTSRVGLAAVDEAARMVTLADPVGAWHSFFHITGFEPHPRYVVWNVAAGWTEKGDWLDDRREGRLRYWPLPGESPDSARALLPVLERLVTVRGEPGRPVQGLAFENITFAHARGALHEGGYAGIQAAFHEGRSGEVGGPEGEVPVPVALRVERAHGVAFEGCSFEQLGGSGLWFGSGSRDGRVLGSSFSGLGGNGLMVGELQEPAPGLEAELACGITVEDSLVERCGQVYTGAVGVWVGLAAEVHLRRNEVRHLPYTGISLGWLWDPRPSMSRGHRIEDNHIHHVMSELSDGGGIYTIGRHVDTYLRGNLIHDVAKNQGRAQNNGFFLDQGSSAFVVENNEIRAVAGSPIRFHMAEEVVVRNNLLATPEGLEPFTYNACSPEGKTIEGNRIEVDSHLVGAQPATGGR